MATDKQLVHQLIDQLDSGQLAAVAHLLVVMTDPIGRSLADAPVVEEELTPDETITALDKARELLKQNPGILQEQVLAELGITQEEIERLNKAR